MTEREEREKERIFLLERLTSKKDTVVKASGEIEDLLFRYRAAGKSDPNGELEKEVWKSLYSISASLSD